MTSLFKIALNNQHYSYAVTAQIYYHTKQMPLIHFSEQKISVKYDNLALSSVCSSVFPIKLKPGCSVKYSLVLPPGPFTISLSQGSAGNCNI